MAVAAPNNSKVQWKFLVFVFGSIPEFWGLKAEVLDIPNAAAFARVKPVPVHRAVLGSSPSLPRPLGSNPATSVYDTHLGPTLSLPNLRSRATVHATSSDEGIIRNTIATRPAAPTFEARNTVSTANTPAAPQSTLPECVTALLQDEDVTAFLSHFGMLPLAPDSELFTLLHGALESKEELKAVDDEALDNAKARVEDRRNELRQVYREFVEKLWTFVREIRQSHTWGLEMRYLRERQGVALPPDAASQLFDA
ncbi:hypothetical protein GSI_05027 [Ganoderma sinense ZZ0214-1]|uniref:Uncharacterized protein n=1 Tax=Ganoderma sinense ZZ0214-1 TaxID=1077348 RepID=A0A2G8SGL1_9APHY|nr:hypothetical protein GSI_05027 [Ganoderma sinense ZZ0214-1]